MHTIHRAARRVAYLFLIPLFALTACDSNPVDYGDDHDEHEEAAGLTLSMNGAEVYRVLAGVVSCAQTPCGFTIAEGEETPLITTTFLAEDGDELDADDFEAAFTLGHAFDADGVAEFEQHSEDGRWAFHLHGEAAGTVRLQLRLLHNDHADFTTPPLSSSDAIVVTVN